MATPRHSVSVAAVITDDHDQALLIQRRDNHHWYRTRTKSAGCSEAIRG